MGWLIALAVLIVLAVLPLGVSANYDSSGILVRIIAGPLRFTVRPAGKKERQKAEKPKKKAIPAKKAASDLSEPEKPKEKGGPITDFLPLVRILLDCLADFPRTLRVKVLEVKVILAGEDPCDLAVNYGRIWAAIGNLWPRLEEIFIIKKRDINVECDFTADVTLVIARLDLTITLARTLPWLFRYGIRALKEYQNIMKTRKGGAVL